MNTGIKSLINKVKINKAFKDFNQNKKNKNIGKTFSEFGDKIKNEKVILNNFENSNHHTYFYNINWFEK